MTAYAAACQTNFPAPLNRNEISDRVDRMLAIARDTIVGYEPFFDIRLLVFPEFAHAVPIHDDPKLLRKHLTVELPCEHITRYEKFCVEYGCYIQTGSFLEHSTQYPDAVFNTTVLVGPRGIELMYRKVNPWIPWEVHTSPHDISDYAQEMFPVAETAIGRIGVAICYDWLFPEAIRQLAFNGAEIINRVSAYMDPWGATAPMDWWTLINRTRAVENTAIVVAANQAADMKNYAPFSWPGGSMIVDMDGRILAQADPGPGEKVVVAPIDVAAVREARARRRGHDMLSHHRADAYPYASQDRLVAGGPVQSIDGLNARIAASKSQTHNS